MYSSISVYLYFIISIITFVLSLKSLTYTQYHDAFIVGIVPPHK